MSQKDNISGEQPAAEPADESAIEAVQEISLPALRRSLDEVRNEIECAIEAAQADANLQLGGLDIRVAAICKALESLSAQEAHSLEPRLLDVIRALDLLTELLTQAIEEANGDGEG